LNVAVTATLSQIAARRQPADRIRRVIPALRIGYRSSDPVRRAPAPRREMSGTMAKPRIYSVSFASVYPLYVSKAEKKGRDKKEVDEIIRWLTGYSQEELDAHLKRKTDLETFIVDARMNPSRSLIKGVICGVRVEDIEDPTMQGIRYLDKLIDELAKGKAMEKILRQ